MKRQEAKRNKKWKLRGNDGEKEQRDEGKKMIRKG